MLKAFVITAILAVVVLAVNAEDSKKKDVPVAKDERIVALIKEAHEKHDFKKNAVKLQNVNWKNLKKNDALKVLKELGDDYLELKRKMKKRMMKKKAFKKNRKERRLAKFLMKKEKMLKRMFKRNHKKKVHKRRHMHKREKNKERKRKKAMKKLSAKKN